MFDSVHDAILLAVAGLYTIVGLARSVNATRIPLGVKIPAGWLSVPFFIAFAAVVIAILW